MGQQGGWRSHRGRGCFRKKMLDYHVTSEFKMLNVDDYNLYESSRMDHERTYSVSELSRLAGVSVRTLHHYDQVGLLKPWRKENGYREYDQKHAVRLQQIIIYRDLAFSIEEIAKLLDSNSDDQVMLLDSQRDVLWQRQKQIQTMIDSVEVTMKSIQSKQNFEIMFEGLPKENLTNYEKSINDRFDISFEGTTEEFLGGLSTEEARSLREDGDRWAEDFVNVIHLPVESEQVQHLIEAYHEMMNNMTGLLEEKVQLDYDRVLKASDFLATDEATQAFYSFYHEDYARRLGQAWRYFAESRLKHP